MTTINPITITPTAAATTTQSAADAATTSLTQNYTTFLKLLTAQLKNQDPTAPMDASQFTQQLVMYSQVEQQIAGNAKLDQLVTAQNASQTSAALSYIGMQVDAPGTGFAYAGQPVQLGYTLPTAAANATLAVTDANGNVVWSGPASPGAGSYNVTWDGTDSNGNAVPNGTYGISLTAADASNNAIAGTTAVPGIVSGIETDNGTLYLTVNGQNVPESSITNAVKPN